MADWVAVSVDLDDDVKVAGFAKALGVHRDTAAMRLVRLWGRMARHQIEDGHLGHLDDDMLEEWAGWRGKTGRFAKAFRTAFMERGTVNGWWKWNGRLLRKARLERQRKRRLKGDDIPPERPPDDPPDHPAPIPGNGGGDSTNNTGTRPNHTTHHPAREAAADLSALLRRLPDTGTPRVAVTEFLEAVPFGKSGQWIPILVACLGGLDLPAGRPCTPEQLATTCRDFMTKPEHQWTPKFFRTCISALMREATPNGPLGANERTRQAAEAYMRDREAV